MLMPDPSFLKLLTWAPFMVGLLLMLPLGMFIGASLTEPPAQEDRKIWFGLLWLSLALFAIGAWLVAP